MESSGGGLGFSLGGGGLGCGGDSLEFCTGLVLSGGLGGGGLSLGGEGLGGTSLETLTPLSSGEGWSWVVPSEDWTITLSHYLGVVQLCGGHTSTEQVQVFSCLSVHECLRPRVQVKSKLTNVRF